jgi:hypothetical protein
MVIQRFTIRLSLMVLSPLNSNIFTDHSGVYEDLIKFKLSLGLKRWFTENKEERRVCQLNIILPQHIALARVGSVK